jgi:hypothetical protein
MTGRPADPAARASLQETTLDLLWIADGVACFAGAGRARLYRAVLAAAPPPEAFAGSEHADRALDGYVAVLNSLTHPLQILVRPDPTDVDAYAERWQARSRRLPPALAGLAREHAEWARRDLPGLGLLERRLYLVVPAEDRPPPLGSLAGPARLLCRRLWRRPVPRQRPDAAARDLLADRCERLQSLLDRAGVRSWRLDDLGLARLYRASWGHRPAGEQRLDRDLRAFFALVGRPA